MIHLAGTGEACTIDAREKAPAGATREMFVAVPGMGRGMAMALETYGQLSLAQALQPALKLADEVFAATPRFVSSPG